MLRKDAGSLSTKEYIQKKCMLSSRFHPVKVESVSVVFPFELDHFAVCAKETAGL